MMSSSELSRARTEGVLVLVSAEVSSLRCGVLDRVHLHVHWVVGRTDLYRERALAPGVLGQSSIPRQDPTGVLESNRTVTRTFRISERAFNALQEDAKRQSVSVNTLVNQIVLSYTNFDRHVKKLHMVKISRPTFRAVLDAAPEDAIIEAGKDAGSDVPRFFVLSKGGGLTLQAVLDHLKDLGDYGNLYEYTETTQDRKRVVTMGHELGPKGTLFFAHYVQAALENVQATPTFTLGDNSITIEF
jgi:hypothetical protein